MRGVPISTARMRAMRPLPLDMAEVEAKRQLDFFTQMAEGLTLQQAVKKAPDQPAPFAFNDHRNLKIVWENAMRRRRG